MSSKIDERVLAMKFEGDQFKKGVSDTIGALDSLKSSLDFEKIGSGVENISSKFSVFGAIAFTAIQGLTKSAIGFGQQIAGAILDPLVEGGKKRALNIEQAKFQFQGLGMDVEQSMADALYAVKGTAFGLDEAAVAAAQFGASGVKSGEDMQSALLGISGVAAMTGSSYGDIADVFTKVAGQGRLMGDDLNRLGARGVNAAATLGIDMGKTESEVRAMVTAGKIDFATFANVMSATFGEHATKANETYAGSLANMRAALARIGAAFATVNFEGKRRLFNALSPAIDNIATALKPVVAAFTEMTKLRSEKIERFMQAINYPGGSADKLPALFNALRIALQFVLDIIKPVQKAFDEVFPPTSQARIVEITQAIERFAQKLVVSEEASANIKMVAKALFSVLKFGIDVVLGIVRVIGFFVGLAFQLGGALMSIISPILTFVRSFLPVADGADKASSGVKDFFDMLLVGGKVLTGWLPDAIKWVGDKLNNFLNGGDAVARMTSFKKTLEGIGEAIKMVFTVLTQGKFTDNPFFSEDGKFVAVLFGIRNAILYVVDAFKSFGKGVGDAAGRATSFWQGTINVLKKVWSYVQPVVQAIGKFFSNLFGGLDTDTLLAGLNASFLVGVALAVGKVVKTITGLMDSAAGIAKGVADALEGLVGVLEQYQKNLKANMLLKIAFAIGILAGALWVLSTIDPARLLSATLGMAASFAILLGGLKLLDKIDAEPSIKASISITLIATAVSIMASALKKLADLDPEALGRGIFGLAITMGLLVGAAKLMSMMEKDIVRAAAAMTIMAAALGLLVAPITLLGLLPFEVLRQGLITIALVLGGLVGASVLLSKFAPDMVLSAVGMMAMAAALGMLVAPIAIMGLLPMDVLVQGMTSLGIVLGALVAAAVLLSLFAPAMVLSAVGLLAMAVALNLLVAPIIILGLLPVETIVQGIMTLVSVIAILVIAAGLMTGLTIGAVGLIAMSAAILLLAVALALLASVDPANLATAIVTLIAAMLLMAAVALVLSPATIAMGAIAGVMALFALGALALSVALMIVAIALNLMGPGLKSATAGLLTFAKAAPEIAKAIPVMFGIGAALVVFGAGALLAGAATLVLGAGLVVMGVGLAILAAVGVLGAFAMIKVAEAAEKLFGKVIAMTAVGAAFLVLGAGVLVLGAGLLVLSAGVILATLGLMMLIPLGALVAISIGLMIKAIEKLAPMTKEIDKISKSLGPLGSAVLKLASNGAAASGGLLALALSFGVLVGSSVLVTAAMAAMAASVSVSMASITVSIAKAPTVFMLLAAAVVLSMTVMNAGLTAGMTKAALTATVFGKTVGTVLVAGIVSTYASVYNSAAEIGSQMIAGMNRGLQNGSYLVANMASKVAKTALNSAKRTLGVASPSKEFMKVGAWADEGLVNGLLKNMGDVDKAGNRVGNTALTAVQKSLSNIKNSVMTDMDFAPAIRPVLDLSAIKKDSSLITGLIPNLSLKVDGSYAMATSLAQQQRANAEAASAKPEADTTSREGDTYIQNNYSPKALSAAEIYRNTKNLISVTKEENPT